MMGESEGQPSFYYNMSLEQFVPQDHPLRAIRPFIDKQAIRLISTAVFCNWPTVDTSRATFSCPGWGVSVGNRQ